MFKFPFIYSLIKIRYICWVTSLSTYKLTTWPRQSNYTAKKSKNVSISYYMLGTFPESIPIRGLKMWGMPLGGRRSWGKACHEIIYRWIWSGLGLLEDKSYWLKCVRLKLPSNSHQPRSSTSRKERSTFRSGYGTGTHAHKSGSFSKLKTKPTKNLVL